MIAAAQVSDAHLADAAATRDEVIGLRIGLLRNYVAAPDARKREAPPLRALRPTLTKNEELSRLTFSVNMRQ